MMSSPRLRIKRGLAGMTVVANPETKKVFTEVTTATTTITASRPGPLCKKSKVTKSEEDSVRPTRVQRFIREMKDSDVRKEYIEAVDKHVDKLLESVRDRRSESSGRGKRGSNFSSRKPSQAAQIAETTKRIDLASADSIIGHVKNPRVLLNPTSFASLPLFYQYKLVKLLPSCDQLIGESGWVKPSAFSLTNEFFTKACSEWCESLKEGKFNPEILTRKRMEMEKEKSKLDPFKLAHFEPIWGAKLDSAIDHRSEYDRIPRTVEFLISPSSFFTPTCSQQEQQDDSMFLHESMGTQLDMNQVMNGSSDETDLDNDVSDSTQSGTESSVNQSSLSPCINKPLKSILKKPRQDRNENGNILIEDVHDVQTIEITSVSPDRMRCSPRNSPQFKMPDISITPLTNNVGIESGGSPTKKVRILSDDVAATPVSLTCSSPATLSLQEVVTLSMEDSPPKGIKKSLSPPAGSVSSDHSPRRPRTPVRGKTDKNSQGVDEKRSQLICKEAVERSENNKLFHFAQNGKILPLSTPQGTHAGSCGNVSSLEFISELCNGNELTQKVPKLFSDVEITPVSSHSCEAGPLPDDTPIEITVQDIRDQTELRVKPSILSNYLSHKQNQQLTLQSSNQFCDPIYNQGQNSQNLPYKLPDGITITPFSSPDNCTSQVSVITRGSLTSRQVGCQDLVRLPSQITVIPLGLSTSDRALPVINAPADVRETNEVNQTIICSEAAHLALKMTAGQQGGTAVVTGSDICACDGKAFTPCASCGSFCHSDCISRSRICFNCIVSANTNVSYNGSSQATAISVISAPNNPGGGQTTAYFCHI